MAGITLSNAVRNNLLSLQNTADLLGRTQERLSTGLKVNSALDDPTAYFTASSLNARASDLNRLLDSVGNAVQTVRAADDGIAAITRLVETAQAVAQQALGKATTTAANVTGTGASVPADTPASLTGALATVDADVNASYTGTGNFGAGVAGSFTLNGNIVTFTSGEDIGTATALIQDVADANGVNVTVSNDATNITITANDADTTIAIANDFGGELAAVGFNTQTVVGNTNLLTNQSGLNGTISPGDTLSFTIGSNPTQTIVFGTGGGQVSTLAELNTALGNLSGLSSASVNAATGDIDFTATDTADDIVIGSTGIDITDFGITATTFEPVNTTIGALTASSTLTVQITGNAATTVTFGPGTDVGSLRDLNAVLAGLAGGTASVDATGNLTVAATNTDDDITIGGTTALSTFGVTAGVSTPTPNVDRVALEAEYNNLLTQIDALSIDASFNGVNLLSGDNLDVIFNGEGTSKLKLTGVTFNAAGLGLTATATDSFQDDATLNTILTDLRVTLGTLHQQASIFGSNLSVVEIRQDFTKNLVNTLETGAANLTLADTNKEGANTLALQTRQQLSSVALSLASEADQNVLRLF